MNKPRFSGLICVCPAEAGKPARLKEGVVTPIEGKTVRPVRRRRRTLLDSPFKSSSPLLKRGLGDLSVLPCGTRMRAL